MSFLERSVDQIQKAEGHQLVTSALEFKEVKRMRIKTMVDEGLRKEEEKEDEEEKHF